MNDGLTDGRTEGLTDGISIKVITLQVTALRLAVAEVDGNEFE